MGEYTIRAARLVRQVVDTWQGDPSPGDLNELLRLLGRWRSRMLVNTFIARQGLRIHGGLFAGMEYVDRTAEGALMPRLLGTYESELHPHLARFIAEGLDGVIDVGCAEGYYAVGLARLLPGAIVYAHDISEQARRDCAILAARNGVQDRVVIRGEFKPTDFEAFAGRRVLVIVDAEGAELDVLRPELSPTLAGMNLIVETHDVYRPGALAEVTRRFQSTHDIVRVDTGAKVFDMPGWLAELGHLDQLLAVWEWRIAPTPWLVMTPKA